jgi:RNA polymerase subunit RPABC4/transcription elongation factor Spt4
VKEACPFCDSSISEGMDVCPACGAYRKEDNRDVWVKTACPFCDTPISKNVAVCPMCGAYRDKEDPKKWIKKKRKWKLPF